MQMDQYYNLVGPKQVIFLDSYIFKNYLKFKSRFHKTHENLETPDLFRYCKIFKSHITILVTFNFYQEDNQSFN